MADLVLKLRVAGDREVDVALAKLGQAAQEAGVKLQPLKDPAIERQSRLMGAGLRQFSQALSATTAVASLFARGNEQVRDALEKTTVALQVVAVSSRALGTAMMFLAANPIGAIVTAVGLLIVAGVALVRNWDIVRAFFARVIDGLKTAFGGLADVVAGFVTRDLTRMRQGLDEVTQGIDLMRGRVSGLSSEFGNLSRHVGLTSDEMRHAVDLATDAAGEAERAATKAAERVKKAAAERAAATLDLLRLSNQQTIQLIEEEEQAAIEAGQRVLEAERQLAAETASLVQLANAQAIAAIEAREQEALESTARMLEAGRQLANETAALIAISNQQAIEAIDEELRARLAAGQQILEADKQIKDEIMRNQDAMTSGVRSALGEIVKINVQAGDVLGAIWKSIVNTILDELSRIAVQKILFPFLSPIFGFLGGLFGLQQGGIVTRPTVAALAEGGRPEAVIPLDRMGKFGGTTIVNQQFHIAGVFEGNPEMWRKIFQSSLGAVIRQEMAR